MSNKSKYDWMGFWVHFFCGAIMGGLIGAYIWARWVLANLESSEASQIVAAILFICAGAVTVGLFAGYFRDKFWTIE